MARRTVVIPDKLAKRIEELARKERKSFSATISTLAEDQLRRRSAKFDWIGAGESGLPDLGTDSEKYLRETFVEHQIVRE